MQRAKSEGDVRKPEDRHCHRGRSEGEGEEVGEGGEEEEEDEKMEQFFAILRNYREARNRRRMELMGELEQEREAEETLRKRRRLAGEPDGGAGERCSSWVPRFEPEDFSADVEFKTRPLPLPLPLPHLHPPPPSPATLARAISPAKAVERERERKGRDDGLELKLTI
ncbi:hypothetical protein ACJRO7_009197 [Eucalyptus globulus]|uniref:Uncharacterized protein n=1 Tax=Eucalyptus globulus TaxID=34317 RepID=A0ABD3IUT1_EUCGL